MHGTWRRSGVATLAALVTVLVLAAGGCDLTERDPERSGATQSGAGQADGLFARIPDIVQDLRPSVVTILTNRGEGSGVVWNADGVIVTNHHVIANTERVRVAFADGQRSPAWVLASAIPSPTWPCCAPSGQGCPRPASPTGFPTRASWPSRSATRSGSRTR